MSPEGTIDCNHVWKRFRSDRKRNVVIDEVARAKAKVTGRQVGARWRWALRDIDFSVEPGGSLALVGANGSGKSTLLKILNQVMYPYAGDVTAAGRVGALIEVTAGIHPMLSGRENAYLYGSLLGLPRKEVARRFDDIVAFAELEGAIDRLVKFYSSGMKMRLGFAVAAFLEPDILLVDEVLAVGDASFQQRCLDRMREVLDEGTTLVFVSHDLAAVEATCERGIWIDDGQQRTDGPVGEVLGDYRSYVEDLAESLPVHEGPVQLRAVTVEGPGGAGPATQAPLDITLSLECDEQRAVKLFLGVTEGTASPIFSFRRDLTLDAGANQLTCSLPRLPLPRGRYFVWMAVSRGGKLIPWHPVARFDVSGSDLDPVLTGIVRPAPVHVDVDWHHEGG